MGRVIVAGVGMVPFRKPGQSDAYDVMASSAVRAALADAGIGYDRVQQAYAGYVHADSCAGQTSLYHVGITGIPIYNVNNNCSSGSSAFALAAQAVAGGAVDCALAVGFEQMERGDMSLEESLAAYERGVGLYRKCQTALEQAELRVRLLSDPQEPSSAEPFAPPDA